MRCINVPLAQMKSNLIPPHDTNKMIDWSIDWLIDWLIEIFIDCSLLEALEINEHLVSLSFTLNITQSILICPIAVGLKLTKGLTVNIARSLDT